MTAQAGRFEVLMMFMAGEVLEIGLGEAALAVLSVFMSMIAPLRRRTVHGAGGAGSSVAKILDLHEFASLTSISAGSRRRSW
jgi:hypothetical protein